MRILCKCQKFFPPIHQFPIPVPPIPDLFRDSILLFLIFLGDFYIFKYHPQQESELFLFLFDTIQSSRPIPVRLHLNNSSLTFVASNEYPKTPAGTPSSLHYTRRPFVPIFFQKFQSLPSLALAPPALTGVTCFSPAPHGDIAGDIAGGFNLRRLGLVPLSNLESPLSFFPFHQFLIA
jgi:hypothetical protein